MTTLSDHGDTCRRCGGAALWEDCDQCGGEGGWLVCLGTCGTAVTHDE